MRHHRAHHTRPRRRGFFSRITGVFRPRQIYLRSDRQVRFIALKPWHQIAALVFGLAGLFWVAYASINVGFKDQLLVVKERRLYQARLEYEDRIAELRRAIDRMNDRLLLDQNAYLDKVDQVRADYDKLVERQRRLDRFVHEGLKLPNDKGATPASGTPNKSAQPQRQGFNEESFGKKYARAFRSEVEALAPLADLRRMFQSYDDTEADILEGVITETDRRVARARHVFRKLGINADALISGSHLDTANMGGPFEALTAADLGPERIADLIGKVQQNLAVIAKLNYEGTRMPVWLPLRHVERITSGFGPRIDPLLRMPAFHPGIDFKAPYGSPVLATASGKVDMAGWDGGYGRVVEINHGFGVKTRFAHLKRIRVKRGQYVKRGQVVGYLGSTGRSTGFHLHYETRVNGHPINPVRFWKVRNELQAVAE